MRKLTVPRQNYQIQFQDKIPRPDTTRLFMLHLVFASMLVLIVIRLFFLQVVQGQEMRLRSDSNRIYERAVVASRGVVTDRHGDPLVLNQTKPVVITDEKGYVLAEPQPISRDEEMDLQATNSARLGETMQRYYPQTHIGSHIIGYVGEATAEEVNAGTYALGQIVGRSGLEKSFNSVLTGKLGTELVETNAGGRLLRRVEQSPAEPGLDIQLYLDLSLQQVITDLFEGRPGAAIASNPQTGEILAMVSTPDFDPNSFIQGDAKEINRLLNDTSLPLLNRSIGGIFPPGSVYKIVPSIAGLENKVITESDTIEDEGKIVVDEYSYRNWFYTKYGRTDGQVDVRKALQRSNDIYFYKLGEWLGAEALGHWSREMGLGTKTGIELPGEQDGLVPTPIWKERVKGEKWYLGNTYHFAIGQGDLLTTPLQVNQMMGVMATEGRWCKPRLVKSVGGETETGVECRQLPIAPETITVVREGLELACQSGGTAFPFFDFDLSQYGDEYASDGRNKVACKTGTAQFYDPEDRTHAWFSVFAPAIAPEIQITVLVEAAGEGSEQAAPIAFEAIKWYFEHKNKD